MLKIQQYIVVMITLYNCMSFKKAEKRDKIYIYNVFY